MIMQIDLKLTIGVSASGAVEILEVPIPIVTSSLTTDVVPFSYKWKVCDIRYGIITLGAKHKINKTLVKDGDLTVVWNGHNYAAKSHKSTKGRIDGLTALFRDNPDCFKVGHTKDMNWKPATNTLEIR